MDSDLKKAIEELRWPQLQKVLALMDKEYEKRITGFIDDARMTLQEFEQTEEKNATVMSTYMEEGAAAHNLITKRINDISESKLPTHEEIEQLIVHNLEIINKTNVENENLIVKQIQEAFAKMNDRIDWYREKVFLNLFTASLHTLRVFLSTFALKEGIELRWKQTTIGDYETTLKKAGWIMFSTDGEHAFVALVLKNDHPLNHVQDFPDTFGYLDNKAANFMQVPGKSHPKLDIHFEDRLTPPVSFKDGINPEQVAQAAAASILKDKGFLTPEGKLSAKAKDFLEELPDQTSEQAPRE